MLEYRLRRLRRPATHARASGREGARFPWESARTGEDVTPPFGTLPNGQRMPILTGLHEEHVTADVAWAAAFYSDWTGDRAFAEGPGASCSSRPPATGRRGSSSTRTAAPTSAT